MHFGDDGINRRFGRGRIVMPDLDGDPRAHDRLFPLVPVGARSGSDREKQGDREEKTAHHCGRSVDDKRTVAQRIHQPNALVARNLSVCARSVRMGIEQE